MTAAPPSSSEHPPTWRFGYPIYHAETRAQWRAWLAAHHDATPGVWLCSWRAATGRPACPYPEAVEEAICFGWIDSTVNVLDDGRALQLITPRKPKSSVDAREPAAGGGHGGGRADDRRRPAGRGGRPGERLVDDLRPGRGPRRAVRPGRRAWTRPRRHAGAVGPVPAERPQGDAVVGHQRRQGRHPAAADRHDRRQGRRAANGPRAERRARGARRPATADERPDTVAADQRQRRREIVWYWGRDHARTRRGDGSGRRL